MVVGLAGDTGEAGIAGKGGMVMVNDSRVGSGSVDGARLSVCVSLQMALFLR